MRKKEQHRADRIVEMLHELYPDAHCELHFEDPLQLLVATVLSAQCTDERVNKVTSELFEKYRKAEDYATADPEVFEQEIRSTGFFRNKAKSILGTANRLVSEYGGQVPDTMDELLTLPGVARKTANVVLGTAFGKATGVVVDTHIRRVSNRLGLTTHNDPKKIEIDLMERFSESEWVFLGHAIIWHGRRVCSARRPRCEACRLGELCPRRGVDS